MFMLMFVNQTLNPAMSWVTPGSGPTAARFIFSCAIEEHHFNSTTNKQKNSSNSFKSMVSRIRETITRKSRLCNLMNRVNQSRLANVGNTDHHHKQRRFPANDFFQLELHQLQKLPHGTLAVSIYWNAILLARFEIMRPFLQ